ncbi:hypothetical protein ACL9RF_11205 [Sphingobacterium sp. Mn56C]|uniref:hypothetical protein n=1 Tax=Sphingobacterium sp. Mn56C TaxID=3395261 RepID=UPI003BBB9A8C
MKAVWKWILGILLAIILILAGLIWYFSRNWKPIVDTKLKEVVHNATDGLYRLNYDNLDLNIALGNVTLSNAELIPDSTVYQQQVATKDAPNNRYHIKLKALKVRSFSLMDILAKKKLNIRSIALIEPNIQLISEYHAYNDTVSTKPKKTLYENVKDIFNSINVRDIQLDKIKFKYSKIDQGKSSDIDLEEVNIKVHDVLVDETSLKDSTRFFYTKMITVDVPGFAYNLPDDFYQVKFDNLSINTREHNVLLTKVVYQPKMSRAAFYKKQNKNVTMAVLKFDTLRFENLDFKQLLDNQQTIASKIQVKNGSADLYADKRYYSKPVNKIGKSPHQLLMKAQKLLRIDTVFVDNISVTYHEFSQKYNREGSISFNGATGTLTNVTNDIQQLNKDKFMRADLKAQIMNSGSLHAKFGFDMLSSSGYYTYSGTVGSMKAPAFNRILQPLLNVEIGSGNIKRIAFNMEGTDRKNWGSFTFDYNELKIKLLAAPGEEEKKKGLKVASFLVNQILINDSNPDANEVYHKGKINYTRVPEYPFFKTLWQSLLDGIKQCAGIGPEREAKLMGTAETTKNVVTGAKSAVQKTGDFIKGIFKKKDKSNEEEEK